MLAKVFELNSKGLYQSWEKKRESCCLVFPASTKPEIRHFHVVIVQRGQRNIQNNCDTRAKLINLLLFCRFRCRRRRRCLSSLNHEEGLFQLTEYVTYGTVGLRMCNSSQLNGDFFVITGTKHLTDVDSIIFMCHVDNVKRKLRFQTSFTLVLYMVLPYCILRAVLEGLVFRNIVPW